MSWLKGQRYKLSTILLLVCLPFLGSAQADSISALVFNQLISNISLLPEFEPKADVKVNWSHIQHFSKAYQKRNSELFPSPLDEASEFYDELLNLPEEHKQNLVLWFTASEPMISRQISNFELSDDLKYLVPALSGMNVQAVSSEKQAGIWQLNHFQGILNGLQVEHLVDERFDVEKATYAALTEIKKNTEIFGAVDYAVLAYLAGKVQLKNVLEVVGDSVSSKVVLELLSKKITARVAAYQTFVVFMHSFKLNEFESPFKFEEVTITREMHFQQLAPVLNIPLEKITALNPQFRFSIVPGDKNYRLRLPAGQRDEFLTFQDSIYNAYDSALFQPVAQKIEYPPALTRQYAGEKVKDLEIEGKTKIKYLIKTGDVLGFIAEDYDVRVADLKYWNNIYNERKIQAGQTIDIFVDNDQVDYYRNLNKTVIGTVQGDNENGNHSANVSNYAIPDSAKKVEHVVKSGESPYLIAKKYEGVTPEAILEWNGISDARKIQIGQKLTIYVTQ